ncbi:hypothetical protein BDY24DRAFT_226154 [Mrakia frigida]|uniref:uncharacterized protein n=1 Tax=Mrakia frigida TaxID=29902 RepID=UPI003FCC0C31
MPSAPPATLSPSSVEDKPFLKFPPWPQPIPQLGGLISFKDFKPMGLLPPFEDAESEPDADEGDEPRAFPKGYSSREVDGAGIPTVDIQVDHDPSRHDKYRRKATKQGILRVDDLFGIGGQEPIATRGGVAYDPLLHPLTRVYRATKEWEVSRKFALSHTYNNIWCHWIKYAQISKPLEKKVEEEEVEEVDSDDEIVEDEDGFISHPEPEFIRPEEGGECRFLADIEGTVRIWLSFEFKDAGLAWLDKQLLGAPLVTKSYLLYLLAHGVLPERIEELEKAVKVCEMAERDMLATKDTAVALEDGFNKLCSRVWGTALIQEQHNGWSTAAPEAVVPEEDPEDDEDAVLANQVQETLNLDTQSAPPPPPASLVVVEPPSAFASNSLPVDAPAAEPEPEPVIFLSSTSEPLLEDSEPELSSTGGSGWELDPNERLHSLSFAPPLSALPDDPSSLSATPTTTSAGGVDNNQLFDDGGWGVSQALLIDPKKALFPPSNGGGGSTSGTYLTKPFESYTKIHSRLSLFRIVSVPPASSTSSCPSVASHELVREERTTPRLGALVLEKWEPVVAPFGEIIAEEEEAASRGGERKTSAPRDAFEEGEGERIVVWVDEEAVKGKVREGMGIFGRFVWVGRDEEGEKGKGGFWFVDVVEALIAEYWLAPESLTV